MLRFEGCRFEVLGPRNDRPYTLNQQPFTREAKPRTGSRAITDAKYASRKQASVNPGHPNWGNLVLLFSEALAL